MRFRLGSILAIFFCLAGTAFAQPMGPRFEVVSVKPASPDAPGGFGYRPEGGGWLSARGVPVRTMIRFAYDVRDHQIEGGPAWVAHARRHLARQQREGREFFESDEDCR